MQTPGCKHLGENTQLRVAAGWKRENGTRMIERLYATGSNPIGHSRIATMPIGVAGVVYVVGYVLLDWISFIEPYARFGITPWNPGTGLSFAVVLLLGRRMIPFLFVAPLLSDIIQIQPPLP